MAHNANRVFINPNFKRHIDSNHASNLMYVNPNFPKPFSISQTPKLETEASKIFINPHFIRNQNTVGKEQYDTPLATTLPSTAQVLCRQTFNAAIENKMPNLPLAIPSAKSRYTFVRNKNENKVIQPQPIQRANTVQINKYKSVNIQQVKRKLELVNMVPKLLNVNKISSPVDSTKTISKYRKIMENKSSNSFYNKHRLVKNNVSKLRNMRLSMSITERDKIRKSLKKNNIPCPLFRKFGKCLRFSHGKCEYLHDKKHVSICRKFLNGVCHNKDCLLSHELSSKKMPTCYFYLKGMCTKDACPYLHVKLNEKTKVCLDFLKGYCEKGNNCLNRHVNICPNIATNGTCIKKRCPYPHKLRRDSKVLKKKILEHKNKTNIESKSSVPEENNKDQTINSAECRYYSESVNDGSGPSSENNGDIKPTRCKLGDLPSFIKFS